MTSTETYHVQNYVNNMWTTDGLSPTGESMAFTTLEEAEHVADELFFETFANDPGLRMRIIDEDGAELVGYVRRIELESLDADDDEPEEPEEPEAWTLPGYWNAVLGAQRDAYDVVTEFGLTADGLDEWLGHAEETARVEGGLRETPEEWSEFHATVLAFLKIAIEDAESLDEEGSA